MLRSMWIPWAYRQQVDLPTEPRHSLHISTLKDWLSNLLEFTFVLPDEPLGWLAPGTDHWTWHWCLCSGHMNTTKAPVLVQEDLLAWFTSFQPFSPGGGTWHCAYCLMPHTVTERVRSVRMASQTTWGWRAWISWHDTENHIQWKKHKYKLILKTCDPTVFQQWDLNKAG